MNEIMDIAAQEQGIKDTSRAWLTYLYSGDVTEAKLVEFKAWLRVSDRHLQAFKQTERVWRCIGQTDSALDWVAELSVQETVVSINRALAAKKERLSWRIYAFRSIAASVAIVLFSVLVLSLSKGSLNTVVRYASARAQILELQLADGTQVTLAGDSAMLVDITERQRNVILLQGSAYFDVLPDHSRVFSVTARKTQIRVKGTAFEVRHGVGNVRVSVTNGLVDVAPLEPVVVSGRVLFTGSDNQIQRLSANEQIVANAEGQFIGDKSYFDKANDLAWLSGRFVFNGIPLKEVIADVNRYYRKAIVIVDPGINDLLITTSFEVEQIEQVLLSLEAVYPLKISQQVDRVVIAAASQ